MSAVLYRWPPAAKFGRVVPKTKFYENATLSTKMREKFVSEVQRITWAYKLADETIHLRGSAAVPEIQVFSIDAKGEDVSDELLSVIDKAIPFPIIFVINHGDDEKALTRVVACNKQLGWASPRLSAYFTTEWLDASDSRVAHPPSLDLASLYAALLTAILPIAPRPGEGVSGVISRMEQAHRIEREIATIEKRLRSEPQLNRKVELRRQLRDRTTALIAAKAPATQEIEELPWTT